MDDIGTATISRKWDSDRSVYTTRIDNAARRIRISDQLISVAGQYVLGDWFHLDGDVLTIRDDYGARVIYRIHWDDYADGGYLAEWPD